MKRDMDLVRKILFEVEKLPVVQGMADIKIENYSEEEITYHIVLLNEAGLIRVMDMSSLGQTVMIPTRLTWDGHEFIDAARDNNRWERAKNTMAKALGGAGSFVLPVLRELLTSYLREELKLP